MKIDVYDRFYYHFQIHITFPQNQLTKSRTWKHIYTQLIQHTIKCVIHQYVQMYCTILVHTIYSKENENNLKSTMRNKSALREGRRILEQTNKLTTEILQHTICRQTLYIPLTYRIHIQTFIYSIIHSFICTKTLYTYSQRRNVSIIALSVNWTSEIQSNRIENRLLFHYMYVGRYSHNFPWKFYVVNVTECLDA